MISRLRRLHARLRDLLRGLLTGQARVREREGEVPRERFRRIARSIDAAELERDTLPVLGGADSAIPMDGWPPGRRLLG
jgi:hypothetical protein